MSSPLKQLYGGAFIICWIDQSDRKNGEDIARSLLDAEGWEIQTLNYFETIARSAYDDGHSPEGLALFDQAARIGSAVKIHTYPTGSAI